MCPMQDDPDSHVQEETEDPLQRRTVLAVVCYPESVGEAIGSEAMATRQASPIAIEPRAAVAWSQYASPDYL